MGRGAAGESRFLRYAVAGAPGSGRNDKGWGEGWRYGLKAQKPTSRKTSETGAPGREWGWGGASGRGRPLYTGGVAWRRGQRGKLSLQVNLDSGRGEG